MPAEAIPARKGDPADPARFLADDGVEGRGEMAAAGNCRTVSGRSGDAHEYRLEAKRAEAEADFIILGHAVGGEGAAIMPFGKPRDRAAFNRAGDPASVMAAPTASRTTSSLPWLSANSSQ